MMNLANAEETRSDELFESIRVDLEKSTIEYPKIEGFMLDDEKMYSTAALFLPHCGGSLAMAVRHAIHQQIIAYRGAAQLRQVTR